MVIVQEFIKILATVPAGGILFIICLIAFIILHNLMNYERYKERRRHRTTFKVLTTVETMLNNLLMDSVAKIRKIMNENSKGELPQEDLNELNLLRFALAGSLLIEVKHHVKRILKTNGYYKLYKLGKSVEFIIDERTKELLNVASETLSSLIRKSSPLYSRSNEIFNYLLFKEMFEQIIDKHIQEIDQEIEDVDAYGKKKLGVLYFLFKYEHKGEDEDDDE